MILYNAGNFPVMNTPGEESRLRQMVLEANYPSFNRLYSFFYLKALESALNEHTEGIGFDQGCTVDKGMV